MSGQLLVRRILERLEQVKVSGRGWTARCPAHDDRHPSLSISEGTDGRALLHCYAGCPTEDIVRALGDTMADLSREGGGAASLSRASATVQHPSGAGLTLEAYAECKGLPIDFLRALGLSNISYLGAPAVRVPYLNTEGAEAAVRFRIAADGDAKFRWKKGAKTMLYGLERLAAAHEAGYVVLIEGESDAHTLWLHGFHAIGLPGARTWNEARDSVQLHGIDTIYVLIEPDRGGETILEWLGSSSIRERVQLVHLEEAKDVSELYCGDRAGFSDRFEEALRKAKPWAEHERLSGDARRERAWASCSELAREPDILARFAADVLELGLVGETKGVKLLYLAMTSRLLEEIVSAAAKGPSSGGKSYLVATVLRFFREEDDFYAYTGMSEKALVFGEEDLRHKMIIIFEAAGLQEGFHAYVVRSLLSEGRLSYPVTEKGEDGKHRTRTVVREGPSGLIVTTTAVQLHEENETRLLSISVDDSSEQTKAVLRSLAAKAAGTGTSRSVDFESWRQLQRWLADGPRDVVVPFAEDLIDLIPSVAVRLRRDVRALLGLIKAHSLLHQVNRPRDGEGRIVATLEDYTVVREIVVDVIAEGVEQSVPAAIVETVEAVTELLHTNPNGVSLTLLAKQLRLDKSSASRRWRVARDRSYLKNLETQKGRQARIALGDPLPEHVEILPTVTVLEERCRGETVAALQPPSRDGGSPPPIASEAETLADLTRESPDSVVYWRGGKRLHVQDIDSALGDSG